MSTNALENLRHAIIQSATQGPFALDRAFLIAGLDDPSVEVPPSYDADVQAAFQVPSGVPI